MRNVFYCWMCMAVCLLAACSSHKKGGADEIVVLMKDEGGGSQRMQESDSKNSFTYKGKEYQSRVIRRPDEKLPLVTNEQGETFVDNSITLQITTGGKSIVDKVFTKQSFAALVDRNFLKHAILERVVYDRNTSAGMVYAASLCYPQSDLYVPLSITVSADGKIALAKEDLLEDIENGKPED